MEEVKVKVKLIVLLISILFVIFLDKTNAQNNLILFSETNELVNYYDSKSIITTDKGTFKVWIFQVVKQAFIDCLKKMTLEEREKAAAPLDVENYTLTTMLVELDCKRRMVSLLETTHFDKQGKIIGSHYYYSKPIITSIVPYTFLDRLYNAICQK